MSVTFGTRRYATVVLRNFRKDSGKRGATSRCKAEERVNCAEKVSERGRCRSDNGVNIRHVSATCGH